MDESIQKLLQPQISVREQGLRALADLANYVETIPDNRWDFNHWSVTGLDGVVHRIAGRKAICGTVGCAIGHGIAAVPSIQALLTLDEKGRPTSHRCRAPWEALGMKCSEWTDLFTPMGYAGIPTQKQVAANIRHFVAHA